MQAWSVAHFQVILTHYHSRAGQRSFTWHRVPLLTDDTSDSSLFEVRGALAIERLYLDRISYSVQAAHFSSTKQAHSQLLWFKPCSCGSDWQVHLQWTHRLLVSHYIYTWPQLLYIAFWWWSFLHFCCCHM